MNPEATVQNLDPMFLSPCFFSVISWLVTSLYFPLLLFLTFSSPFFYFRFLSFLAFLYYSFFFSFNFSFPNLHSGSSWKHCTKNYLIYITIIQAVAVYVLLVCKCTVVCCFVFIANFFFSLFFFFLIFLFFFSPF